MIHFPRSQQWLSAFKGFVALVTLLALPMASQADSLMIKNGPPQLVAIESNLRQLPSVRVFLANYLIPPLRGLSFRVQWTADGQPMDPNTPLRSAFAERHVRFPTATPDESPPQVQTEAREENAEAALAQPAPKALGRVERAEGVPNVTVGKSFCEMAASARAAGRPTAAALQQRCDAELAAHSVPVTPEPPIPPPRP